MYTEEFHANLLILYKLLNSFSDITLVNYHLFQLFSKFLDTIYNFKFKTTIIINFSAQLINKFTS